MSEFIAWARECGIRPEEAFTRLLQTRRGKENEMGRRIVLPAYLDVLKDGRMVALSLQDVLADDELRGQVIHSVLAEVEAWRNRYGDLIKLVKHPQARKIVRAIDRAKKERGNAWPTDE
jgi:hypothetical protein